MKISIHAIIRIKRILNLNFVPSANSSLLGIRVSMFGQLHHSRLYKPHQSFSVDEQFYFATRFLDNNINDIIEFLKKETVRIEVVQTSISKSGHSKSNSFVLMSWKESVWNVLFAPAINRGMEKLKEQGIINSLHWDKDVKFLFPRKCKDIPHTILLNQPKSLENRYKILPGTMTLEVGYIWKEKNFVANPERNVAAHKPPIARHSPQIPRQPPNTVVEDFGDLEELNSDLDDGELGEDELYQVPKEDSFTDEEDKMDQLEYAVQEDALLDEDEPIDVHAEPVRVVPYAPRPSPPLQQLPNQNLPRKSPPVKRAAVPKKTEGLPKPPVVKEPELKHPALSRFHKCPACLLDQITNIYLKKNEEDLKQLEKNLKPPKAPAIPVRKEEIKRPSVPQPKPKIPEPPNEPRISTPKQKSPFAFPRRPEFMEPAERHAALDIIQSIQNQLQQLQHLCQGQSQPKSVAVQTNNNKK